MENTSQLVTLDRQTTKAAWYSLDNYQVENSCCSLKGKCVYKCVHQPASRLFVCVLVCVSSVKLKFVAEKLTV